MLIQYYIPVNLKPEDNTECPILRIDMDFL
jgi:hypothetical protein